MAEECVFESKSGNPAWHLPETMLQVVKHAELDLIGAYPHGHFPQNMFRMELKSCSEVLITLAFA